MRMNGNVRLIGILVLGMLVLASVQAVGAETAHVANHVVISEVQIEDDDNTKHDFVEIYNPTDSDVDLGGYEGSYIRLMKYTSKGTESLIKSWKDESAIVPTHGYYLWASSKAGDGWNSTIGADASTTVTITADNAVALEIYETSEQIDTVGWGSAPVNETSAYPDNPSDGESIERKAIALSTASDMAAPSGAHYTWGNGEDTNDNSADFITKTSPEPQNSASDPEDCPAQSWFLSNVSGSYIMYKEDMSKPEGAVTVSDGSSTIWKADEPATVDVGFTKGTWTGMIMLSEAFANGETFTVEVGSYDGATFTSAGSQTSTGAADKTTFSLDISATVFDISKDDYLALNITNPSDGSADLVVKTGCGNSYVISPETDPGYPVPELSTLILFSTGLLALAGYVLLTKRRR